MFSDPKLSKTFAGQAAQTQKKAAGELVTGGSFIVQ